MFGKGWCIGFQSEIYEELWVKNSERRSRSITPTKKGYLMALSLWIFYRCFWNGILFLFCDLLPKLLKTERLKSISYRILYTYILLTQNLNRCYLGEIILALFIFTSDIYKTLENKKQQQWFVLYFCFSATRCFPVIERFHRNKWEFPYSINLHKRPLCRMYVSGICWQEE
jgi:hypothetical protein